MTAGTAYLVIGLTLGDEGKGGIVDFLGANEDVVLNVRFAADPNSAHYVMPDEQLITFAQIGSALANPDIHCHLGHETLLRLASLMTEIDGLSENEVFVRGRLTIDPNTLLVLPWHAMVEQLLEISRGHCRNGTSGVGASVARNEALRYPQDVLRFGDLFDSIQLEGKLEASFKRLNDAALALLSFTFEEGARIHQDCIDRYSVTEVKRSLATMAELLHGVCAADNEVLQKFGPEGSIVAEGTQGMLLNPRVGFRPHVSSCDNSGANARTFFQRAGYDGTFKTIGVLRAYATRFGPGPLVTADSAMTAALPEMHNEASAWNGDFRAGHLDLVSTRYALRAHGDVDSLAVTHLDRVSTLPEIRVCIAYEYLGSAEIDLRQHFVVEESEGKIFLTDIRIDGNPEEITKILWDCRPARYQTFTSSDTEGLLNFLEDERGLGTPVSIVSYGPRRSDKKLRNAPKKCGSVAPTLHSNIQKVAAKALSEGFGIPLPAGYDPRWEYFVDEEGKHVGYHLLWDFEKPSFVAEVIERSHQWIQVGEQRYQDLCAAAAQLDVPMDDLVRQWGAMYRAYFSGSLDHVVPFEAVRARILELTECEPDAPELFDILTPEDGKTCHYHNRHPVLLHLAYAFRKCPSGRWIGTYDGFSRCWLASHYTPLSLKDATNVGIDPTEKGVAELLRELRISRTLYESGGCDEAMEEAFQKVREELRSMMRARSLWCAKARAARESLLARTSERARPRVQALLTLLGQALQLNEETHNRIYLGLGILRLAAQARGETGIRMTRAFMQSFAGSMRASA